MQPEPAPIVARARHGDRVVAESSRTVRVDHPDEAPALWFPASDCAGDVAGLLVVADDTPPYLDGHVTFDPERVVVDLVEGADDDPRDVAVTRFPNWGDVAHLADVLDVRRVGGGRYRSVARG